MSNRKVQRAEFRRAYFKNRPALAIELARRFLLGFPDDYGARLYLAMALLDLKRFDEARWVIEDALLLCPTTSLFLFHRLLGQLHEARGDSAEAEHWYRKAIDSNPEDAGCRIYFGAMLARLGKFSEAEEQHRSGTTCSEGCVDEAYLNLGFVLRAQERYVEAYDCFKRALAIDPGYKAARRALDDMERVMALLGEA